MSEKEKLFKVLRYLLYIPFILIILGILQFILDLIYRLLLAS